MRQSVQAYEKFEEIKVVANISPLPLWAWTLFTSLEEQASAPASQLGSVHNLCGQECHIAVKWRLPTFNRVDIWKPCGFSVSPPGQMIFRWLFITTCSDAAHIASIIGESWQTAWWGSSTVGENHWWVSFIQAQLSGSFIYFLNHFCIIPEGSRNVCLSAVTTDVLILAVPATCCVCMAGRFYITSINYKQCYL